jgi:hypothetical protein
MMSGCGCGTSGGSSRLRHKTPDGYLREAYRLRDSGDPAATQAMYRATLAVAAARAAKRGDMRQAAQGMMALRGLESTPGTTNDLDTMLRDLGTSSQVRQYVTVIQSMADLANGVVAIIAQMTGNATDPGVVAALGWMRFVTGSQATPPGMGEAEVRGLARFVRDTAFMDNPDVIEGIMAAVRGVGGLIDYFTRSSTASDAIQVVNAVVGFFRLFRSRLASSPRIQAILAEPGAPPPNTQPIDPTNCMTLTCPPGQVKGIRTQGGPCECMPPPSISPAVWATQNYRIAVAARKLVEGILVLPEGRLTAGARRANCSSACTLLWASTEVKRELGSIPAITGTPAQPAPMRYFDARTAPRDCNCAGMRLNLPGGPVFTGPSDSGGGSGMLIVGAAVVGAFLLLR